MVHFHLFLLMERSKMTEMNYQKIIIIVYYDRIEKYIKSTNDSGWVQKQNVILVWFSWNSKSAHDNRTYIGLQSKLKRLSIADVKLLLAGSVIIHQLR